MSDRELLELAAKAAGLVIFFDAARRGYFWAPSKDNPTAGNWWNPALSDGDAFRLAAACGIAVTPYPVYEWPKHSVIASRKSLEDSRSEVVERYGSDPLSATRRAITRVAAEIGRGMT
jgi:hypothetical protein